jgi:beta-glucosidase
LHCGGFGLRVARFRASGVREEFTQFRLTRFPPKGFQKILLQPGEKKTVKFMLTPEELAFYDRNMERRVEPGTINVMVGSSSEQIRLRGSFEVR